MIELGTQVQTWRKLKKLSRRDLASAIGVAENTVDAMERGREVPIGVVARACAFLGHSLRELVLSVPSTGIGARPVTPEGRAVTPALLDRLDEQGFRELVLLPLFRSMGFADVEYTHGGILEQGADFVLWEEGRTGAREPIPVVVKAGSLNGATTTERNTAATTANQIRAALQRTFRDPRQHTERGAARCWLFVSGDIGKEAHLTFSSQLTTDQRCRVTYHDGAKVMALVEKHLGAEAALANLEEAARRLTPVAPPRHSVSTFAGTGGVMGVAVHPNAGAEPISFSVKLRATDGSPDEQQASLRKALDVLHYGGTLQSGDGVHVELAAPSMFSALLPAGDSVDFLQLQTRLLPAPRVLTFRTRQGSSILATMPQVVTRWTRPGPGRVEIRVEEESEPLRFSLTLDMQAERGDFKLAWTNKGETSIDAVTLASASEFAVSLKNADQLELVDERRGVVIFSVPVPAEIAQGVGAVMPDQVHPVLHAAAQVQRQLNREVMWRRDRLTPEWAEAMLRLSSLLASPSASEEVQGASVVLQVAPAGAEHLRKLDESKDPGVLVYRERMTFPNVVDAHVVVAHVETRMVGARLDDASRVAIESLQVADGTNHDSHEPSSERAASGDTNEGEGSDSGVDGDHVAQTRGEHATLLRLNWIPQDEVIQVHRHLITCEVVKAGDL